MSVGGWIYIVLALLGILLFYIYTRIGRLLRCAFFTALSGWAALVTLWLFGGYLGLDIAPTPVSALISGLLGIPGVLAMLVLNLI